MPRIWVLSTTSRNRVSTSLIPKQTLKTRWRELGVADSVLDLFVAQIALGGSGIDTVICQLVAAANGVQ